MKPNHDQATVISIVGMHRSGTSMVARLLHDHGLYLGPEDQLLGGSEGNPLGHFEHQGFLCLNEELLAHLGGSAFDPPKVSSGWEKGSSLARFFEKGNTLTQTFRGHLLWGWKEPRTTLLLPFWKKLIPNIQVVICVRNPIEVGDSVMKRGIGSFEKGIWLWNEYTRTALRETQNCRKRIVFYEDFFREENDEIRKLVEFCGLPNTGEKGAVENSISRELRHHEAQIDNLFKDQRVLPEPKLLYLGLRQLASEQLSMTSGLSTDDLINSSVTSLLTMLDAFHDESKLAQIQTALTLKDLEIETFAAQSARLAEENKRLASDVLRIKSTLFWKFFMAAESLRDQLFPLETRRRAGYDRFLRKLKSALTGN